MGFRLVLMLAIFALVIHCIHLVRVEARQFETFASGSDHIVAIAIGDLQRPTFVP